jgi:N-acetylglutamate synthase
MTQPDPITCLRAMEATWPPKACWEQGGWLLRDGGGGGKRVGAATALNDGADPAMLEAVTAARGGGALVRLGPSDTAMQAKLQAAGYYLLDPSLIYAAPIGDLAEPPAAVTLFNIWPPLAIMREVWAENDIGPARLAVMDRACSPRTAFVARIQDRVAGVAFCAIHDGFAMLHAVAVTAPFRRKGVARNILRGAAHWAQEQGADWLALAVTKANTPARALYEGAGMRVIASYCYYTKD